MKRGRNFGFLKRGREDFVEREKERRNRFLCERERISLGGYSNGGEREKRCMEFFFSNGSNSHNGDVGLKLSATLSAGLSGL